MAQDKKISRLDALKAWFSQGIVPHKAWAAKLGVSPQALIKVRKSATYLDVTVESLSQAEQDELWQFLKRVRKFAIAVAQGKKKSNAAFDMAIDWFLAGKQIDANDDLLSLPAANVPCQSDSAIMTDNPGNKQVQSTVAEFLPVSDEAYHADDDGYEVVDDDPDDELYDEVDDSGDDPARNTSEAPALSLADLKQKAAAMNAANPN